MAVLAAKTRMNYVDADRKGLWTCFKKYLAKNQHTIVAGLGAMSGSAYYVQQSIWQGK